MADSGCLFEFVCLCSNFSLLAKNAYFGLGASQSPQDVDSVCGDRLVMHNASSVLPEISPQPYHALCRKREHAARPKHGYLHDRF
jgi:hypothetical protein